MKTFTYPQTKWVMTGALLIALGFTVSFNKSAQLGGSMDFSSTEKPADESLLQGKTSKVYTPKGAIPVRYLDNGENKVLAIVPIRMTTEGKVCDSCGFETIPLVDVKNKEDIEGLNVKLMQAFEKKLTEKSEKVTSEESGKDKKEEKEKTDHFAKIEKECKSPGKDADSADRSEHLECMTKAFLEILNNDKLKKEISSSDASRFFKKEIQPFFVKQIRSARDMHARYSRMFGAREGFARQDDAGKSASSLLNDVYTQMGELVAEIPSKYESLRENIIQEQSQILKYEASLVKDSYNRATDKNLSPEEFPSAVINFESKNLQYNYMRELLRGTSMDALQSAQTSDNISIDLQDGYNKFIQKMMVDLQTQMLNNSLAPASSIDITARTSGQRGALSTGSVLNRTISNGRGVLNQQIQTNRGSQIVLPRMPQ